jgi:excisionase family DNA binding protein
MQDHDNTANTPERRALRVNEFCTAYGLSRSTVYKLMKTGKLRTVLIGGRRVVPVDAAEGLLKEGAR